MKNSKEKVSCMQEEVWLMKDRIYNETKNLNIREFFSYIENKCKQAKVKRKKYAKLLN